jgi:hypothetical protein
MPAKMEKELRQEALKRGLTGKRKNAYVYGTMRKTGWKPQREQGK